MTSRLPRYSSPLLRTVAITPSASGSTAVPNFRYSSPVPSTSYGKVLPSNRFPTSYCRSFNSSSISSASEAPQSPFETARSFQSEVPLFERLQQNPQVLQSIEKLATIIKSKTGVDLRGGEAPSLSMMAKLASDPELREAASNLMLALKAAGIEVDPRTAFKALQAMGGDGFEKASGLDGLHAAMRTDGKKGGEGEEGGEGNIK